MMGVIAERTVETAGAMAGSRAVKFAFQGNFRKAIFWGIPVVVAGILVWYMRR
jgi:hypothetical protein